VGEGGRRPVGPATGFQPTTKEKGFSFIQIFLEIKLFDSNSNLNFERLLFLKQNITAHIDTEENMQQHECIKKLFIDIRVKIRVLQLLRGLPRVLLLQGNPLPHLLCKPFILEASKMRSMRATSRAASQEVIASDESSSGGDDQFVISP
jgi:hypothetical protein